MRSTMEEISYWVYTKRAPCLYNYDNQVKRQLADAQRAAKPASSPSDVQEVVTPKKKIKRKLSLLGDESASPEKQQNLYFETSQQKCTVLSSCKSDSLESEIDFNIKNSSIQVKPKRIKLQNNRNSRTVVHKKNKVVTSTPKAETPLRRSLRHAQRPHDYSAVNYSFELLNTSNNNKGTNAKAKKTPQRPKREKNNVERNAAGDHETKISIGLEKIKKNGVLKPFDDVSDVSGLTANYIRSTKVQATRSSRNLRSKSTKLTRKSQQDLDKGDGAVVYTNKSVNTKPKAEDSSTDSSENVINFVTKTNHKKPRANKSTSLPKFVDAQTPNNKADNEISQDICKTDQNIAFQPRYGRSGHPRELKATEVSATDTQTTEISVPQTRNLRGKICLDLNDTKENPEESTISRTRSGRSIGLRQAENAVLVINNSTEQISSGVTLNVAEHCANRVKAARVRRKKHLSSSKRMSEQRSADSSDMAMRHVSTRERSGFAACFSDSETEGEPVKARKFFC